MAQGPTTVYPSAVPITLAEGTPKVYTVSNPGAGNEWSRTVPGEGAWLVLACLANFTASAAVANRLPSIRYSDSRNDFFAAGFGTVTAGLSEILSGGIGASTLVGVTLTLGTDTIGLPFIILQPGWTIRSSTGNLDAGDTYTAISLHVLELPYGPTGYVRGPALIDTPDYAMGG